MLVENEKIIKEALLARKKSYAPYSKFQVGACLEAEDGTLYHGCNIENASYPVTNCAERTSFFKAVSEGKRHFRKIAIVGGSGMIKEYCPPCGMCLQVMMEFCDPETFEIILGKEDLTYQKYYLKELLPKGFGPCNL